MRLPIIIATAAMLATAPAHADKIARMPGCGMQENINVSVNFNFMATSFADAKAKFDEKIKQVNDFAAQQGIKKFDLQSMNYNINSNNYNSYESGYQMNGSASYQLDSSDSAFKLAEFLQQQKFQVSVNANSYRNNNGTCNN